MAKKVYLDYNATTPLAPEVFGCICDSLKEAWANPNSCYDAGTICKLLAIVLHLIQGFFVFRLRWEWNRRKQGITTASENWASFVMSCITIKQLLESMESRVSIIANIDYLFAFSSLTTIKWLKNSSDNSAVKKDRHCLRKRWLKILQYLYA